MSVSPYHTRGTTADRLAALLAAGVALPLACRALNISKRAAQHYIEGATGHSQERPKRHCKPVLDGQRCRCGLLLPCTCTGPMHAVDFMGRRGEPAPCSSGLRGSNAG